MTNPVNDVMPRKSQTLFRGIFLWIKEKNLVSILS